MEKVKQLMRVCKGKVLRDLEEQERLYLDAKAKAKRTKNKKDVEAVTTSKERLIKYCDMVFTSFDYDNVTHFKTVREVATYVMANGWKVTRPTVYKHQGKGYFKSDSVNGFSKKSIEEYARKYLKQSSPDQSDVDDDPDSLHNLQERKLKAEVRKVEALASKEEHNLKLAQGKSIPREDMERELIGRAVLLDGTLRHHFKVHCPELAAEIGANQDRLNDFTEWFDRTLDDALKTFSTTHDFVVDLTEVIE